MHPNSRSYPINMFLFLYLPMSASSQGDYQAFNEGYDLFAYATDNGWPWKRGGDSHFVRSNGNASIVNFEAPRATLLWTHTPTSTSVEAENSFIDTTNTMGAWFLSGDPIIALLPDKYLQGNDFFADSDAEAQPLDCATHDCSPNAVCGPYFYCMMNMKLKDEDNYQVFRDCLINILKLEPTAIENVSWSCLISLSSDLGDRFNLYDQFEICQSSSWNLSRENWVNINVDELLQLSLHGGVDDRGLYWEGRRQGEIVAQAVGRQFWNIPGGIECSVKAPCRIPLDCTRIGSWTALSLGYLGRVTRQPFTYLVSSAFLNLNQQLWNQYNELKDALQSLALDTFSIGTFFPSDKRDFDVQNSLTGLSIMFTILGGIIPGGAALTLVSAGTIASGVGSFLANSGQGLSNQAQQLFSGQVKIFYNTLIQGLENLTAQLFAGESISNPGPGGDNIDIFDIIRNGTWVNTDSLTKVSELSKKTRREILARCIDSLWKSPTSNKMWVLFTSVEGDNKTQACLDGKLYQSTTRSNVMPASLQSSSLVIRISAQPELFHVQSTTTAEG